MRRCVFVASERNMVGFMSLLSVLLKFYTLYPLRDFWVQM